MDNIERLYSLVVNERAEIIKGQQDCVCVRSSTWSSLVREIHKEYDKKYNKPKRKDE